MRIVCSTNRRLEQEVREGRFREDLFYRLNVIEIELPPLRERRRGPAAARSHHFMEKFSPELGKDVRELEPEVLPALEALRVPRQRARAREHRRARGHAGAHARASRSSVCPRPCAARPSAAPAKRDPAEGVDLDALLAAYETSLIQEALQRTGGVKKRAAALLGVTFRSLRYRLEKLHLDDGEP